MRWLFLLILVVLAGCGDERGSRDVECDDTTMLADAEDNAQRANKIMKGYGGGAVTEVYVHICDEDYPGSFDAFCYWEVDSVVDEEYCYQGTVCRPIADKDVESKRAELCK